MKTFLICNRNQHKWLEFQLRPKHDGSPSTIVLTPGQAVAGWGWHTLIYMPGWDSDHSMSEEDFKSWNEHLHARGVAQEKVILFL